MQRLAGSWVRTRKRPSTATSKTARRHRAPHLYAFVFCEGPSSHALGPQRPFAIARPQSPTLARRGQTLACFHVWVHNRGRTLFWNAHHTRASGRRFAPYPNEVLDGGQKMRRSPTKALPNSQINSMPSRRQTHFRGAERHARVDPRKTKHQCNRLRLPLHNANALSCNSHRERQHNTNTP
jgi:hypothetical protein